MRNYQLQDLHDWAERASAVAQEFGLDCFPQEFEICDHEQMLGYMSYSGMPSHYPHWSYGKQFEKQKTMYDYGVSGLPYEMVINSNPCLAYLMRDNSLLLQVLTIAHVYGHNDFFKNNFTFAHTQPEYVLQRFKMHADRIRGYVEDPGIGIERVEAMIDAAHALSLQCQRNMQIKRSSPDQVREQIIRDYEREAGDNYDEDELRRRLRHNPPAPEENLLEFIRDNNPELAEWQRDIISIVVAQTRYFIPQMETKIMNEGWASYWHHAIMSSLDLPQDMHMEFLVRHAQVLRPHPGGLNPYHLGYKVLNAIRIWYDGAIDEKALRPDEHSLFVKMREDFERRDAIPFDTRDVSGIQKLFQVREADRDKSFLRQYLTPAIMEDLNLFEFERRQNHRGQRVGMVTNTSNTEGWRHVKESLLANIGTESLPVIKIEDAGFDGVGTLLLRHYSDGRELEASYAQHTLKYVKQLWHRAVRLEAIIAGKETAFTVDMEGNLDTKQRKAA